MPRKAGVPCKRAGCPGIVRDGVCSVCGPVRRERWDERESAARRGYDARWRKVRAMFLGAHPLCEECARHGRVEPATDVHHVVAKRDGGSDAESNLQALCHSCHSRVTGREMGRHMAGSAIPVTIVAGPPGSGKTTYVRDHMRTGDLVVDVDALYAALSFSDWYDKPVSLLPFVIEARDAVLRRLAGGAEGIGRAWVVTGTASESKLLRMKEELRAEKLLLLDVSQDECYRRVAKDKRRKHLQGQRELIDMWFAER